MYYSTYLLSDLETDTYEGTITEQKHQPTLLGSMKARFFFGEKTFWGRGSENVDKYKFLFTFCKKKTKKKNSKIWLNCLKIILNSSEIFPIPFSWDFRSYSFYKLFLYFL